MDDAGRSFAKGGWIGIALAEIVIVVAVIAKYFQLW